MLYSKRLTKKRRTLRVVIISLVVLAAGTFMPFVFSYLGAIAMAPVHAVHTWLSESSSLVPTFFRDRQSLLSDMEELEHQLAIETRTSATNRHLIEENERLRALLGSDGTARIEAAVIGRPGTLPYDYLQIDRGTNHGIEVGAPVFIGRDVVIGLVAFTVAEYSFVQLVTTPDFEATTFISGPNIVATMEGVGGGVARVRVPQGIPLSVGNLVYLPSVEPGIFGRVSYVENEPTQPEQYGYLTFDTALSGIHKLTVGKLSQISRSAEEIDEYIKDELKKTLLITGVTGDLTATTTNSTASTTTNNNLNASSSRNLLLTPESWSL